MPDNDQGEGPPKDQADTLPSAPTRRVLFLDDDPERAAIFQTWVPEVVWVQTVEECKAKLTEAWDEVHLDHDLGGERYVDHSRDDCGMEIVRWICNEPRPHLLPTRFFVHSHNPNASNLMVMQMYMAGYQVEARPFGIPPTPEPLAPIVPAPPERWLRRLLRFLGGS